MNRNVEIAFDSLMYMMERLIHLENEINAMESLLSDKYKIIEEQQKDIMRISSRVFTPNSFESLHQLITNKKKVQLVRMVRDYTDCDLKQAYDIASLFLPADQIYNSDTPADNK